MKLCLQAKLLIQNPYSLFLKGQFIHWLVFEQIPTVEPDILNVPGRHSPRTVLELHLHVLQRSLKCQILINNKAIIIIVHEVCVGPSKHACGPSVRVAEHRIVVVVVVAIGVIAKQVVGVIVATAVVVAKQVIASIVAVVAKDVVVVAT